MTEGISSAITLPFCIMCTIIHDPLYRELFVYNTEKVMMSRNETEKLMMDGNRTFSNETEEMNIYRNETYDNTTNDNKVENYFWCITRYSNTVQNYNTIILFFHLVAPFVINLVSALFIIFGVARKRSAARNKQTYKEHVVGQLNEHKQLIVSPIILLVLAIPRLIISLLSGCMKTSDNPWLYLIGYFISFIPSMLIFVVFVLPSELYRKTFKESFQTWQRHIRQ